MKIGTFAMALSLIMAGPRFRAEAQAGSPAASADPVSVFTEHPRLLLRPARLKMLKRERERASVRWRQLEALVAGGAPLPEPGLAQALYYRISGNAAAGKQAIAWALGSAGDLRQVALVFDWCQDLLDATQKRDLAARLLRGISAPPADESVPTMRSRAFAAVALFDDVPDEPQRELQRIVHGWWEGKITPPLEAGRDLLPRNDGYALLELLFVIRDNTNLDLRETCPRAFKDLPVERLMSYYPAAFEAPENQFRIGFQRAIGEPDTRLAALSRAADMALVAYDPNAGDTQSLQGWLMHDNFIMRGPFGAPYEFLWANPYQPGLSYYHLSLTYHDQTYGKLFVRSSWDDDAIWFGYSGGVVQKFENGRPALLDPHASAPVRLGSATIFLGDPAARKFRITLAKGEAVFLAALEPRRTYQVEVDDEEMFEAESDPGGILELDLPHEKEVGVRVNRAATARERFP